MRKGAARNITPEQIRYIHILSKLLKMTYASTLNSVIGVCGRAVASLSDLSLYEGDKVIQRFKSWHPHGKTVTAVKKLTGEKIA